MAMGSDSRPPAPMPCSARNITSCGMFCAAAASTDAARNTTMVAWKVCLRPNRSLILPTIGVAMHWVMR